MSSPPIFAGAVSAPRSTITLDAAYIQRRNLAFAAAALAVVGVISVFSTAGYLYALWTTDPLKSIGAFIPVVSFPLILRAWRSLGWEMNGSWWGLAILVPTIALVHLRDHAILELILTPSWTIFVPPHSLVAFAYTAGVVLLFGGPLLFRKALFPVVLMWFVNPVPHVFNLWVDLPLQHISATMARGFAHALGQKLSPDQLRLMFTPEFGMFIAPGCNGMRGAITMGFIALIAGYMYRFRLAVHVAIVAGAVLLGYLFNLVRLCVLVLYYIVALHIPWLQTRATMGDYIIGACLFFFATLLLFNIIKRWSATGDLRPPQLAVTKDSTPAPRSAPWRIAAFVVVIALGSFNYMHAMVEGYRHPQVASDPSKLALFPQHVGNYTLQREWNEYLPTGPLIFYWAQYTPDIGSGEVAVGISPVLGAHDTLICHAARGEDWLWHGDLEFPTREEPTHFSGSFFNDGATQYMEATTICTGATCGQYSSSRKHFGFSYSRPDTTRLLAPSPSRPIPVLLRTATTNTSMAADAARAELTANFRNFLSGAQLSAFTQPYR